MQGQVAYKPLAHKPTPNPPANLFARLFTCPHAKLTRHISINISANFLILTFCKSQTNKVSVDLEPWIVDDEDDEWLLRYG